MATIEKGYLDNAYMVDPLDSGSIQYSTGFQVRQVVVDKQTSRGFQAREFAASSPPRGFQARATIVDKQSPRGFQARATIVDKQSTRGFQAREVVSPTSAKGFQAREIIGASSSRGFQVREFDVDKLSPRGLQVTQYLVDRRSALGVQSAMTIKDERRTGFQVAQAEIDRLFARGFQVNETILLKSARGFQVVQVPSNALSRGFQVRETLLVSRKLGFQVSTVLRDKLKTLGFSAKADTLRHALLEFYLETGYMQDAYLGDFEAAFLGFQAKMINKVQQTRGFQATQVVTRKLARGFQAQQVVNATRHVGLQVSQLKKVVFGLQTTMVIYNVTQLRIMTTFPSRGTPALGGHNWTSTSTATGDFSPFNLNTDIIEQVFRSAPGSASSVTLACDTGIPQGVPIDTLAILGHNLTKSAVVQIQGSNAADFSSINFSATLTTELANMYYVSPVFPNQAAQNHYWRFIIQDPTNPAGYLQIGAILFGTSHIFSVAESFDNPVIRGYKHFKDSINTEGFTNVMNDRALKRWIKLKFNDLNYFKGNFQILENMITSSRTSLKTLVIPTPEYPSRFAIFAKLTTIPDITHNSIGLEEEYINIDLEWDESL